MMLSLIASSLFIKYNYVYGGHDTQFHFKRIMELIDSLKHNQILPDFSFNEFHGSAVMVSYPYLNLIPVVLLSFIIKSKVILVYGYFIFNTFITFIISFISSNNYIKSYSTSYIFSIIYSLSNIFLYYNLITTDFGIVSSFIFLPLIIFGFLKLINANEWIELSLGMILLSFSHILNLVIITAFLLLWLIINFKLLNKTLMFNLLKSILLFFVISSIVILPFLHFFIFNNVNMPYTQQLTNVNIKDFMKGILGGKSDQTIGFFPIITIFLSTFFYKNFNKNIKQMYILSLLIIIIVLFLPWKIITSYRLFNMLNQIQFTSRFLIIPQMLLSFIFSLIVSKYVVSNNKRKILYIMIVFITILLQLVMGQYTFINKYSNNLNIGNYLEKNNNIITSFNYKFNDSKGFYQLMNSYQDTNDDYIPKSSISMSSYVNRDLGFYNDNYQIKMNHIGYNTFNFSGKKNMDKLSLPIYAYNKEKLYVYLNDKQVNNYANKNGLLTINNIKNNIQINNNIYIKTPVNKFRIIGAILSILGLLFILVLLIKM